MKILAIISLLAFVAGTQASAIALPVPDANFASTSVKLREDPQPCEIPQSGNKSPKRGKVYCCDSVNKKTKKGNICWILRSKGFWDTANHCPNGKTGKRGKDFDYYCCINYVNSGLKCLAVVR